MSAGATVLAYHAIGVCNVSDDPHSLFLSPEVFETQMAFLSRHRRVVPLDDLVRASVSPGKPAVAITFDDGYRATFEQGLPILERYELPASVFVPTRFVGDRNRWDEPSRCSLEIMTEDELRAADARGLSVESHGHGHLDLSGASVDEARQDLAQSIAVLTEVLARRPRFLAYPFSRGSRGAQRAAAELGFVAAFNVAGRDEGQFSRARVPVTRVDPPWLFRLQTAGQYSRLRYAGLTESVLGVRRRIRRGLRRSLADQ